MEALGRSIATHTAAGVSTTPPSKRPLGPQEMRRILAVTDALGIHRESVSIPLLPQGEGDVRVSPDGRVEIVASESGDLDPWIARLPQTVAGLDLSQVRRA